MPGVGNATVNSDLKYESTKKSSECGQGKRKLLSFGLLAVGVWRIYVYTKHQMRKLPGLTFKEAVEYTTRGKADAVIVIENRKEKN